MAKSHYHRRERPQHKERHEPGDKVSLTLGYPWGGETRGRVTGFMLLLSFC